MGNDLTGIFYNEDGYFIGLGRDVVDAFIAKTLDISLKEYHAKLIEYGGKKLVNTFVVYFERKEDADRAFNEYVIPLYTMKKLEG